jgi:hypothetical protein
VSEHKHTEPVAKAFLLCRELFQDVHTREVVLIGPIVELTSTQFPFIASVNVFGQFTSLRGSYHLKLQVEDAEGGVVWGQEVQPPIDNANPLFTVQLCFGRLPVYIPGPGKYDMVLLANNAEVARYTLAASYPNPPAPAVG